MSDTKWTTVGVLREWLAEYPPDTPLYFGAGDLEFYRVKNRGSVAEPIAEVQFNEVYRVLKTED